MKVMLGDFIFKLAPEKQIDFTGARSIAKIDIPGAPPIYQDMGEDEHTFAWSGILEGDSAESDCNGIDKIKASGQEVRLVAGFINKGVKVKDFNYSYIRKDMIRYSITLVEIQNAISPFEVHKPKKSVPPPPAPRPQPPQVPAPTEPSYITHVMRSGDTLWGLAVKHYGNGNLWQRIANASGISNPRRIPVGYVAKIPI